MRLRLQISRHALPDTRLLWQARPSLTIAQFLQLLNVQYPLETAEWGLEDYIVSVAGYEALHYHRINDVFQADDEVCIRPLETNEVKQRRLLGREQIADNGMHLFDGLPFGRHNNTALNLTRPPIRIPPRNLIGIDLDEEQFLDGLENNEGGSEPEDDEQQLAITAAGETDDDEDDESYHGESDVEMSDEDAEAETASEQASEDAAVSSTSEHDDDGENEEPWKGFPASAGAVLAPTPTMKPDSSSQIQSNVNDGTSSSAHSSSESEAEAVPTPSTSSSESSSSIDDSSSESDSSSDDSSSDSDSGDEPEIKSSKSPATSNIPFNGTKSTKDRNRRRVIHKKMLWLKKQGLIPEDASHEDVKVWMERNEAPNGGQNSAVIVGTKEAESHPANGPELNHRPSQGVTAHRAAAADEQSESLASTLMSKRNELLAQIEAGGIDISASSGTSADENAETVATSQQATPPTKKARLDVTSSQRLLLGALGVKVPKTAADRQKVQEKLSQQTQRKPVDKSAQEANVEVAEENGVQVDINDPEFWRSRIHLSAVECCPDAAVQTLSEPPFPFYQRWDPALTQGKKRKRKQNDGPNKRAHLDEDGSYVYTNGEGVAYGEDDWTEQYDANVYDELCTLAAAEQPEPDSASRQLLIESRLSQQDDDDEIESIPELPEDISSLPRVNFFSDLKVGDLITYSVLEVSAQTGWQPGTSPLRTARVWSLAGGAVEGGTPAVTLLVAKRDMPVPQYDEDGKRIYERFEMPDDADEFVPDSMEGDTQQRYRLYKFEELVQPRLVMRWNELADWREERGLN